MIFLTLLVLSSFGLWLLIMKISEPEIYKFPTKEENELVDLVMNNLKTNPNDWKIDIDFIGHKTFIHKNKEIDIEIDSGDKEITINNITISIFNYFKLNKLCDNLLYLRNINKIKGS